MTYMYLSLITYNPFNNNIKTNLFNDLFELILKFDDCIVML
jgi:hypothetical protein